jgi:hypothetical protein
VVTVMDMTVGEWLVPGAVMILFGSAALILTAWAFCVRPAPRELRIAREMPLWLLAARVLGTEVFGIEADLARVVFWNALGLLTVALAVFNVRAVIGADGDRCD